MINFRHKGDFTGITGFIERLKEPFNASTLDKYGKEGVAILASATPVDSGLTASSWYYEIRRKDGALSLCFCNSNYKDGVPIAIILQYGHATGTGGWVEGRDYINPSIQPLFDELAQKAWKEVGKS